MDYYEVMFMILDAFDLRTHQELVLSDSAECAKESIREMFPDNEICIMESRRVFERIYLYEYERELSGND